MHLRIRRGSRPHQLLKYLAIGSGVLAVSLISPLGGAQLIKAGIHGYLRKKKFERDRFLRDMKRLQTRELVDFRELGNGKIEIRLTKQGKKKMLAYELDDMKLKIPERWDRQWRLIIFDIPHRHKKARDALRTKLLDLKFYPIQKSVFITPYPCEDEIDFIASIFDVRNYIIILYISHFEGEVKLKRHFGI